MQLLRSSSDAPPPPGEGGTHLEPVRARLSRFQEVQEDVLEGARRGDSAALEQFIRHYQVRVFAFLSRSVGAGHHVEDVAQEVFLRVCRALPRFETGRAKVSTWIFQIAVRLLQDRKRSPRRVLVPIPEHLRDDRLTPEESCARRRLLNRIELLAEALPDEQRMALVLAEFHGQSYEEISVVMGVPVATVKTRVFRARQFLREELRKSEKEES